MKTVRFAHTGDLHIGSYENDPKRSSLEEGAFYLMVDHWIERKVDFAVIAGDLFDSSRPDLSIVDRITKKMRYIRYEENIGIYAIYGSHDYNPGGKSIIDILVSAGLIDNLFKGKKIDSKLKLEFTIDNKTGIKLIGIPGKRMGLESEYYKDLDKESLENEDGIKIFVFHSGLDELVNKSNDSEHVSINCLPKGFDYYAGGHVHNRIDPYKYEGYGVIAFPGVLFSVHNKDLKDNLERGFYIVDINEDDSKEITVKTEFVPINVFKRENYNHDINDNVTVNDLKHKIIQYEVRDKVVTLNIDPKGKSISKVDLEDIENMLINKGALCVNINTHEDERLQETSGYLQDTEDTKIDKEDGIDRDAIEKDIFKKELEGIIIGNPHLKNPDLKGDPGINIAIELLRCIGQDRLDKTGKDTERVIREGIKVLKLENALL